MYVEPRPKFTKLLNIINCAEMAADPKYIRTVLGVQYRWRIVNMTRSRPEAKSKQRIIFDSRVLSRT